MVPDVEASQPELFLGSRSVGEEVREYITFRSLTNQRISLRALESSDTEVKLLRGRDSGDSPTAEVICSVRKRGARLANLRFRIVKEGQSEEETVSVTIAWHVP